MTQCVIVQGDGSLLATTDAPAACAGYLLVTPDEYSALQSVWQPLSISDGELLGGAVLLLWAIAWTYKVIARSIRDWDQQGE